jgi:hypothetical protein
MIKGDATAEMLPPLRDLSDAPRGSDFATAAQPDAGFASCYMGCVASYFASGTAIH